MEDREIPSAAFLQDAHSVLGCARPGPRARNSTHISHMWVGGRDTAA